MKFLTLLSFNILLILFLEQSDCVKAQSAREWNTPEEAEKGDAFYQDYDENDTDNSDDYDFTAADAWGTDQQNWYEHEGDGYYIDDEDFIDDL